MAKDWRETERRSPRFEGLEEWPTRDILDALLSGQNAALHGVSAALPQMEEAVEAAANRLKEGSGRLVYTGAGTSGRLAVLDGIELTPTFGWPTSRIAYLFAGGMIGLTKAVEGAEDNVNAAQQEVDEIKLTPYDVVLGLAASGTTPYTRAAIERARNTGALTISFANNPKAPLLKDAEFGILLDTGAEVLAGSTRLGAGTSQKAALNLFSTSLMARLHKIHQGYMVDMLATNDKLKDRAMRMVLAITSCSEDRAKEALTEADYHVKLAVLIAKGSTKAAAQHALDTHFGDLKAAQIALKL